MTIFDRYILKSLIQSTLITAVVLSAIILLTQSIKFLELIMSSGASSGAFWTLSFLALPRLFEIVLPIAIMIGVLFTYNRLASDSELTIFRAAGKSPICLGRPVLIGSVVMTAILLLITTWGAPTSLAQMKQMRQVIKAQYSSLLIKEGVFNKFGDNITVYVNERQKDGSLQGIIIHDNRSTLENPSTVIAEKGILIINEQGQQVLVYNGARQEFDSENRILQTLDFERYTIDLPESDEVPMRWKEPDERTLFELLNPDLNNQLDRQHAREMQVEVHKRLIGPFISITFALTAVAFLILGPINRQGQARRMFFAIITIITLQGLYLSAFNLAQKNDFGLVLMYLIILLPTIINLMLLSKAGDHIRHKLFFATTYRRVRS